MRFYYFVWLFKSQGEAPIVFLTLVSHWGILWNTVFHVENNPSFVLQQAICSNIMKQSGMSVYNLHKLQQLKWVIFWHKLQYSMFLWFLSSNEWQQIVSHCHHLEYSRGPLLRKWRSGVWVTRRQRVLHVWRSLCRLSRNTAVGGSGVRWWQQHTTLSSAGRLGNSC